VCEFDDNPADSSVAWFAADIGPLLMLISGRWVLPIFEALEQGPLRRKLLRGRMGPVSDKVLTETLRRLETNRLVRRQAVLTVPVEVDYSLTPLARTLWPILRDIQAWVVRSSAQDDPTSDD
jgi:DNA-binding HxlR family transcriptional regulator